MSDRTNSNDGSKRDANVGSRRATLKKILAGGSAAAAAGALPAKWTRPVVDALVLPAHAATSAATHFYGTVVAEYIASTGPLQRVIDGLISPAYADIPTENVELCIDVTNGGTQFNVQVQVGSYNYLTGSGTVGGSQVVLNSQCGPDDAPLNIAVSSISATEASFTLNGYLYADTTIPAGGGCPTKQCGQ